MTENEKIEKLVQSKLITLENRIKELETDSGTPWKNAIISNIVSVGFGTIIGLFILTYTPLKNMVLNPIIEDYINKNITNPFVEFHAKGVVYNESGNPLEGVRVTAENTKKSFYTDENGNYEIESKINKDSIYIELVFYKEGYRMSRKDIPSEKNDELRTALFHTNLELSYNEEIEQKKQEFYLSLNSN